MATHDTYFFSLSYERLQLHLVFSAFVVQMCVVGLRTNT